MSELAAEIELPIPITVVGGYLGAGKTTLINHLLRHADGARLAILVNDFGDIGIDADLIESAGDTVMNLAGGCVCCTIGNDLIGALYSLSEMAPRPDHVVIETSGVALPRSVAGAVGLAKGIALAGVVVLVDAADVIERAADRYVGDTVERQVADADLIVINKCDSVDSTRIVRVREWIGGQAPGAIVLEAEHGGLPNEVLLAPTLHADAMRHRPARLPGGRDRMRPVEDAGTRFVSAAWRCDGAVDAVALAQVLGAAATEGMVRAKAIVEGVDGRALVVQAVGARQRQTELPVPLGANASRLVCIGVRELFDIDAFSQRLRASGNWQT
ncbi:MAG: GTP-binding protein [Burkholderiaceae bacterium]|nr:GTP-binding protein [Burkholderiaceae bacterium]